MRFVFIKERRYEKFVLLFINQLFGNIEKKALFYPIVMARFMHNARLGSD